MVIFLFVGILILGLAVFGFTEPEFWKDMQILLWIGVVSAVILIFVVIGLFVFRYIVIVEININGIEKKEKMTEKASKRIHDMASFDIVVTK
jgi:flagellar biosynthesis/type III secretory pathway M-ring protein FliF/YscJ